MNVYSPRGATSNNFSPRSNSNIYSPRATTNAYSPRATTNAYSPRVNALTQPLSARRLETPDLNLGYMSPQKIGQFSHRASES